MTALRLTIACDPGLKGALATLIDGVPGPILDMPCVQVGDWGEIDARAVAVFVREQRANHPGAYVSACIEKVGARPKDGKTSVFRFGKGVGRVEAVFDVLGIPVSYVIPAVWKRKFGLLKQKKDASRQLCLTRFPEMAHVLKWKKNDGRADALLIALWHDNVNGG